MMSHLVLLDNEAVAALRPEHAKHRKVVSHIQVVAHRKRRGLQVHVAVPNCVRVEGGWDRSAAGWAFANQLRIADVVLDAEQANQAAEIRTRTKVSVADAHVGAAIRSAAADRVTVLTSDPGDMRRVAGDSAVTVVAL